MNSDKLAPYFLLATGAGFVLISFPKIRHYTINRLQSADYLPKIKLKPKDQELIAGAGPNLSLFIVGAALIGLGILELVYS